MGDASTDRISSNQRIAALSEATVNLAQKLNSDHQIYSVEFNFYDSVNEYKLTTSLADMVEPVDLVVKDPKYQDQFITRKSPQELRIEIGEGSAEESYAIERRDTDVYALIIHQSRYGASQEATFDSLTEDGTWTADTTNSDATNVTIDTVEYTQGSGSLNFDVDVSQSGNNKATIYNSTMGTKDLTDFNNLGAWIFDVYIPDVTNFSSVTFYWGSDTSNYWSAIATTDIHGGAFANGLNKIKINWEDATATLSPDVTAVDYIAFDFNYTGSQADDTDFRIDNLVLVRPEKMRMHYLSWNVGTTNAGAEISVFTATNDVPFFSGKYDQFRYYVEHRAAAILFGGALRLKNEADEHNAEAEIQFRNVRKLFPSSLSRPTKSFKPKGINFNK